MPTPRSETDPRLFAMPLTAADLAAYQDGAIVSRTILDKEEGTVTIFAFDTGQRLSTHSAPFDALVQVLDGTAAITIENAEFLVNAGQWIVMPANKPHAVRADAPFKMALVMIRAK